MEKGTCKRMQSSQSLDQTGPESSPYFAPAATGSYRSAPSESYQFTTCLTNVSYFFHVALPPSASPEVLRKSVPTRNLRTVCAEMLP